MSNSATHLKFLDMNDIAYPVNYFIQHVHNLIHIRIKGNVTLKDLHDALMTRFEGKEAALLAAKEFIDFQKENDATDDTILCTQEDDEEVVFHFDLHMAK